MNGGTIHPPCINRSENACCIKGKDIFLGLGFLKDLESAVVQRLVAERRVNGAFSSLNDFMDRVAIGIEQLAILVRIGAFRFTGQPKAGLLWAAIFKIKANRTRSVDPKLFRSDPIEMKLPELESGRLEDAYDQMELLGFPLYDYFDLIDEELQSTLKAADMADHVDRPILLYGLLVHTKFKKTKHGKRVRLSTFVDLDGHYFDVMHFPTVVDKYPIHGIGVYACFGKVTEEFGQHSIQAIWTRKIAIKPDPRVSDDPYFK
jgi:DNA polymerase-3 subunit alpha